ncbi:MAG: hypothetical protein ABJP34_01955 [Erythrobacter sp.]
MATLAQTSNVSKSAEVASIQPATAYRARRKSPEFAAAWMAALWEGYIHLEMELLQRLREGKLTNEDGEKYDFANAIRLLAAHRDTAARAQAQQRNVSAAEVRASLDQKVEDFRIMASAKKAPKKAIKNHER